MAAVDAGFMLAGTPDQVAEGLRREIETAGVNYVLTRFAFGNLTFEEELRSATLFAREVMPRFVREPSSRVKSALNEAFRPPRDAVWTFQSLASRRL